jgi:hypothetical protein
MRWLLGGPVMTAVGWTNGSERVEEVVDELEDELEDEPEDAAGDAELELDGLVVSVEVVESCVVDGGGDQVEVGGVVVGGGGLGGGGGSSLNHQVPYRTPTDSSAKNWKRPVEKSSPPQGHPGH